MIANVNMDLIDLGSDDEFSINKTGLNENQMPRTVDQDTDSDSYDSVDNQPNTMESNTHGKLYIIQPKNQDENDGDDKDRSVEEESSQQRLHEILFFCNCMFQFFMS